MRKKIVTSFGFIFTLIAASSLSYAQAITGIATGIACSPAVLPPYCAIDGKVYQDKGTCDLKLPREAFKCPTDQTIESCQEKCNLMTAASTKVPVQAPQNAVAPTPVPTPAPTPAPTPTKPPQQPALNQIMQDVMATPPVQLDIPVLADPALAPKAVNDVMTTTPPVTPPVIPPLPEENSRETPTRFKQPLL